MTTRRNTTQIPWNQTEITVNLPTPVPVGKAWPVWSVRNTESSIARTLPTAELTTIVGSDYTQIKFQRSTQSSNDTHSPTIEWEVIWGDEYTVESGLTTISGGTGTVNVTISDVTDLTETFVQSGFRTGEALPTGFARARLTTTTNLELKRETTTSGTSTVVSWYVVRWTGANVQYGLVTVNSGNNPGTDDLAQSVDTAKAFLIFNYSTAYSLAYSFRVMLRGRLSANDQVEFAAYDPSVDIYVSYYAIMHPDISVQHDFENVSGTGSSKTITEIDLLKAFSPVPFFGNGFSNITGANQFHTVYNTRKLSSTTQLDITRGDDGGTLSSYWQVVKEVTEVDEVFVSHAEFEIPGDPEPEDDYPINDFTQVGIADGITQTGIGKGILGTFIKHKLRWVIFPNGGNIVFRTKQAATGGDWSADTTLISGINDAFFINSVFDGTYLHLCWRDTGTAPRDLKYQRVLLNANGTVTGDTVQTAYSNADWDVREQSIVVDQNNLPVILFNVLGLNAQAGNYKVMVAASIATDGTWTARTSFPMDVDTHTHDFLGRGNAAKLIDDGKILLTWHDQNNARMSAALLDDYSLGTIEDTKIAPTLQRTSLVTHRDGTAFLNADNRVAYRDAAGTWHDRTPAGITQVSDFNSMTILEGRVHLWSKVGDWIVNRMTSDESRGKYWTSEKNVHQRSDILFFNASQIVNSNSTDHGDRNYHSVLIVDINDNLFAGLNEEIDIVRPTIVSPAFGDEELAVVTPIQWDKHGETANSYLQVATDSGFQALTYDGYDKALEYFDFIVAQKGEIVNSRETQKQIMEAVDDLYFFRIYFWTSKDFGVDSDTVTSFVPYHAALTHNTTYYARVKVVDNGGESEWSETVSFTTVSTPAQGATAIVKVIPEIGGQKAVSLGAQAIVTVTPEGVGEKDATVGAEAIVRVTPEGKFTTEKSAGAEAVILITPEGEGRFANRGTMNMIYNLKKKRWRDKIFNKTELYEPIN